MQITDKNNMKNVVENNSFWTDLDRKIRRTQNFINWLIDGQGQHGISPSEYPNLTAEKVEELYNVDFGN